MEQMNLHKQKLYSLIVAGVALIALLLPWMKIIYYSANGMRSWGLLSFLGVIGVAVACFMGNKALAFDDTTKKIAMASFGAIALGALIFFFNISGAGVTGFGLWLCLIAGLAGLAWTMGLIKLPDDKKPPVS